MFADHINLPSRMLARYEQMYPKEPDYYAIPDYDCDLAPDLPQDPTKRNILIIGDSISLQYTPFLQTELPDFNVVHHRCNAAFSAMAVQNVDEYLALRADWAAVIFNVGIWDLNTPNVTAQRYSENLRRLTGSIRRATRNALFLTTKIHPSFPEKRSEMNAAAIKIMDDLLVRHFDLGAESEKIRHLIADDLVHFADQGAEHLAEAIAQQIRPLLD